MDAGSDGGELASDAGPDASGDAGGREDAGGTDGGMDGGSPEDAGGDAAADAGPCVIETTSRSGDATTYDPSLGTACGAGLAPWYSMRAAVSPTDYAGAERCGTCAAVSGPAGDALVLIDDLCPGCAAGDLDLSADAFLALTGDTSGRYPISWQIVPCEPPGNVFYDFQGSNPFYVKVRLTRQRNPVARVEIQRVGGAWAEATRTTDGFFTLSPGEMLPTPLPIRATDVFGDAITFSAPDLTNDLARDSGAQFAAACAP